MVKIVGSKSTKGGKNIGKDVKLQPGDDIDKEVIVDVKEQALHIFGRLPEGHTVSVYRVYDGENECIDIPDIPVMCNDGCSPLMLFNEANPECPTGRFIQDDIWLFYQGRYKLVYNSPDGDTEIPESVYVWCKEDRLVSKLAINLPLCGENQCPPSCSSEHVISLQSDAAPSADPDCLKCQTPLAIHNDSGNPCDLALYYWAKDASDNCSDEGEWERINFAEWLDSLADFITEVEITGEGGVSGSGSISDASGCVGKKLTLALTFTASCPPDGDDITIGDDDEVFYCGPGGSPVKGKIILPCSQIKEKLEETNNCVPDRQAGSLCADEHLTRQADGTLIWVKSDHAEKLRPRVEVYAITVDFTAPQAEGAETYDNNFLVDLKPLIPELDVNCHNTVRARCYTRVYYQNRDTIPATGGNKSFYTRCGGDALAEFDVNANTAIGVPSAASTNDAVYVSYVNSEVEWAELAPDGNLRVYTGADTPELDANDFLRVQHLVEIYSVGYRNEFE